MFPSLEKPPVLASAFLCLRRGVSSPTGISRSRISFSLPTQRCFRPQRIGSLCQKLFSAYAEVFPQLQKTSSSNEDFSLPTQRCFLADKAAALIDQLFSAYAEVFLSSPLPNAIGHTFLCLRRGVSSPYYFDKRMAAFSLPTQRCFRHRPLLARCGPLFSAYAEVFRQG